MKVPLVVVNSALKRSGALARSEAGFIKDGGPPEVAFFAGGACASRLEHKTMVAKNDFIHLDYTESALRCASRERTRPSCSSSLPLKPKRSGFPCSPPPTSMGTCCLTTITPPDQSTEAWPRSRH